MRKAKTIGQLVDQLADKYFASGMDAYTAGVCACLDVAKAQIALFDELSRSILRFCNGFPKAFRQEVSGDGE